MASVASSGVSPLRTDPTRSDTDDSWAYVEMLSSSNPGSVGFFPSPASGSLNSWGVIGIGIGGGAGSIPGSGQMHQHPSPLEPAPSPLYLDDEQSGLSGATSFPECGFDVTSAPNESSFMNSGMLRNEGVMTRQDFMFTEEELNDVSALLDPFAEGVPQASFDTIDRELKEFEMDLMTPSLGTGLEPPSWDLSNPRQDDIINFVFDYPPQPYPSCPRSTESPVSPLAAANPLSPQIKKEAESTSSRAIPLSVRKVGSGSRVEKKRKAASTPSSMDGSPGSKFVIVTPNSVIAHAGKPNPFECFEAMPATARGRKGPLANDTKENALHVRRLGACFCCHSRKVKCDKERPCKNCKKLMVQVPQVVCWQFQDFLTVLFPDFIRSHFKREEMNRFISDNVSGFTIDGMEMPCSVELFSGTRLSATLTITAKFFTPKTHEVLQHWHMNTGGPGLGLQTRSAAPIGLDTEKGSQRDAIKKLAREYISAIAQEPAFPEQSTDSFRKTQVPRTILQIVQTYSRRSGSPIVKRALSIFAMHFVMTRHLCLTRHSIMNLQPTNFVPQNAQWITPRVLNRQIKSVIDELLMREMQAMFENFSKSLKPKSRKEWAPCLAAFLVLCLFMESLETAADHFVYSQNEINVRSGTRPQFKQEFALSINREVENMPFKQFAFQFHQVYQTHSKDSSAKSFNPLVDDSQVGLEDLDAPALEMVLALRQLLDRPSWDELDFLSMDPILPNIQAGHFPRNIQENYTGRLVAKFLLSFLDETYIFDTKA